jgi:hypothetical protein
MKKTAATVGLANIVRGDLPGHALIQFPSGRWGFAGKVDSRLAHVMKDGTEVTPAAAKIAREFGPALAGVKTRTWDTSDAAIEAAASIGIAVST